MRFIHMSDLHIGKIVNRLSMEEDQEYILGKIIEKTEQLKPDAVVIAGDVYDKASPSSKAVSMFDDFLFALSKLGTKIFIISGNHDSAERTAYASRLLSRSNVFVSPVYNGKIEPITLSDEYGEVNFYLLPFIKPAIVRNLFKNEDIADYNDTVKTAVAHMNVDTSKRNVLVMHQFLTDAKLSGSEERSIGGSENIDASIVEMFDYVALGHIHRAQSVSSKNIRYSGAPLKYSFDEVGTQKSICLVELKNKSEFSYEKIELEPLRDMRVIRGSFEEIINKTDDKKDDYIKIILTDESDIPDAAKKIRAVYPNFMLLSYDNKRTRKISSVKKDERITKMEPIEVIDNIFEEQNGKKQSEKQRKLSQELIKEIWG
ncbi:MAG: exonuclease SbcCD subunit D [Firmicutes bacterium]|nr:exonuclease SbcCD subunit D [Bacillota bacterium]